MSSASERAQVLAALESSSEIRAAFVRRADVVANALTRVASSSVSTPAALDRLEASVPALASVERRVGYFLLALSGRFLDAAALDTLAFEQVERGGSLTALVASALRRDPGLLRGSELVELVPVPPDEIVIDVSHTEAHPHMSGIQRVVRMLSRELSVAGARFRLVRMRPGTGRFEELEPAAVHAFFSFRSQVPWRRRESRRARFAGAVKAAGRWMTLALATNLPFVRRPDRVAASVNTFFLRFAQWRGKWRERLLNPKRVARVPLLVGHTVVLSELTLAAERIELYLTLKRQFDVRVGLIAYDLIALQHPEFCEVSDEFSDYLRILRVVDRVSCISDSVRRQFASLLEQVERAAPAPVVRAHLLAGNLAPTSVPARSEGDLPLVLCVGTIEPRKNQLGLLRAATILWRQGRRFRLVFAGNPGWMNGEFLAELERRRAEGLDVALHVAPDEAELLALYSRAAFSVFCSFAEGFGLPIVESLALGCPCLTSSIGSMAEIAAGGGCLTADPRSPDAIAEAMDRLLGEPALRARLAEEIRARPTRTWADYAREVHAFFSERDRVGSSA